MSFYEWVQQLMGHFQPQGALNQQGILNTPLQSGASPQTMRTMATDPDLDKGLYQPAPQAQPLGGDPTQQVTQDQYNQMLQSQKAAQDKAYQAYKVRR